jgi:hypothetical protein
MISPEVHTYTYAGSFHVLRSSCFPTVVISKRKVDWLIYSRQIKADQEVKQCQVQCGVIPDHLIIA